ALDGEIPETGPFPMPPNRSGDGVPGGDFVLVFDVDAPGPAVLADFTAVQPLGSLVYESGQGVSAISPGGDTDRFLVTLRAGQALSVFVDPDATLRPTVEVRGPSGAVLAAATAAALGSDAVVQAVLVPATGTYTITVSAAAG